MAYMNFKKNKAIIRSCILLFCLSLTMDAQGQIITTIAGIGSGGYSGDGGAATSARLDTLSGVAVDGLGNLYIVDETNQRIRKVSASGIITTIAGNGAIGFSGDGGPATLAELNYPTGIAVDGAGNVYIADSWNNRIRMVNTTGIITTVAGTGVQGYSGDGGAATSAQLYTPHALALDGSGNLYISDTRNNCIRRIGSSGIITTIIGTGIWGYSGDGGPASSAQLKAPVGITLDAAGNIFFADNFNQCIRKVSTAGTITTIAGNGTLGFAGDGGSATAAEFNYPMGVAVDRQGNLYVSDYSNNRIRKVSTTGIITTIAGDSLKGYNGDGGLASLAELNKPYGVALDGAGNLFIGDGYNNRVRMISGLAGISEISNSNRVIVYPVPSNGNITALLDGNGYKTLLICDLLGREVYSQYLEAGQSDMTLRINMSDAPNGIYFVQVMMENGIICRRIEVQR